MKRPLRGWSRPALALLAVALLAVAIWAPLALANPEDGMSNMPGMEASEPTMPMSDPSRPISWNTNRVWVVGGEALVELFLSFFLAVLWLLVVALQLARPYILGIVDKFTLRVGADLWWLTYQLLRDLLMVVTFVLSIFLFYPMLVPERANPVFGPVAAALLFAALVLKLTREADDDPKVFGMVTNLVAAGGGLFLANVLVGVEARMAPATAGFARLLVTNTNPNFAFAVLWVSMLAIGLMSLYAIWYTIRSTYPAGGQAEPVHGEGD